MGQGDLFVGHGLCQEHSMDLEYIHNQADGVDRSMVLLDQDPQVPSSGEERLDIKAANNNGSSSTLSPCVRRDFIFSTSKAAVPT